MKNMTEKPFRLQDDEKNDTNDKSFCTWLAYHFHITCGWLAHDLHVTCTKLAHDLYDLQMTCTWLACDLNVTCTGLVQDKFKIKDKLSKFMTSLTCTILKTIKNKNKYYSQSIWKKPFHYIPCRDSRRMSYETGAILNQNLA